MSRFVVGSVASIPPGTVTVVRPEGDREGIGVFNVDGEFFALRNRCPHMGAPLCSGSIKGTSESCRRPSGAYDLTWTREGEIVSCPWHHWEFDIRTGRTIFPSKTRVRRYDVEVDDPPPLDPDVAERLARGAESVPVVVEDASVVLLLDS